MALLGSLEKPKDFRASFFGKIYRVAIGTIALSSLGVPSLQAASYIAARYSLRRHVADSNGVSKPIISFQTQKQPILTAVAQSFVLQAMHKRAITWFMDPSLDPRVRHAVATVNKVTMIQTAQWANLTLGDRCGAQGLFEVNLLSAMHVRRLYFVRLSLLASLICIYSLRCGALQLLRVTFWESLSVGIPPSLLCFRVCFSFVARAHSGLASELLLARYALESPTYPDSPLAKHEAGLFSELRAALAVAPSHRSAVYDQQVLPRSLPLIQAIGHRIAYDAAREAQVDGPLLDLFEVASMLQDEAWYVEQLGMTRAQLREREARAIEAAFPHLEEYLSRMELAPYVPAPIVSEEKWERFLDNLQVFGETRSGRSAGAGIASGSFKNSVSRRSVRSML